MAGRLGLCRTVKVAGPLPSSDGPLRAADWADLIEGVRDASFLHVATGSDQANRIETLPTCDPDELDEL